ncbi:MAG: NAD(P)/FAD-dependent oxidoreductase [Myxococcota bacterium]
MGGNRHRVVVGAGVTGLASALALARRGHAVTVLDAGDKPGQGVTSRNSQVLHAGLYYPSGSLKARLCVEGRKSLLAFCQAHHVPHALVGKFIVATSPDEELELHRLLVQGLANGVVGLELVGPDFVRSKEPGVRASAALWSPGTGIVDVPSLVDALDRECRALGVTFAFRHRVTAVKTLSPGGEGDRWLLTVDGPDAQRFELPAHTVVNAAGLHADTIAALVGLDVPQHWVKGSYFRLTRRRFRHLVYPVPAKHLAGLGVHVTVGLDGDTRLGPDVELLEPRSEDYAVDESRAARFAEAAARYLPGITVDELAPDQAGIRPKLSRPGEPWRDFRIEQSHPGFVHCLGMESPGLTACLAVGEYVAQLLCPSPPGER